MTKTHRWPVRVYYEDTDMAGVVYYANYLKFFERARTELLRAANLEQSVLLAERNLVFVVRRCEVDYLAPAKFDDLLEVRTHLEKTSQASFEMRQELALIERPSAQTAHDEQTIVTSALVRIACISSQGRPTRIPDDIRSLLTTS